MAQGTPDTTNAPSDLCERNEMPCITANTPVEAWLFGPDGKPKTFKHTFHFFFQVPDLVQNHIGMIKALPGGFNGSIGYLYPNDPDGTVFAQIFDPAFKKEGWKPTDPGRFQQGLPDFSAIINQFKRNRVEVVTGVLAPPDLQNYLQQAAQAGYRPKMYVIDKGTGYPEPMKAIGKAGENILSVNFWSPALPGQVEVRRLRRRRSWSTPTRRDARSAVHPAARLRRCVVRRAVRRHPARRLEGPCRGAEGAEGDQPGDRRRHGQVQRPELLGAAARRRAVAYDEGRRKSWSRRTSTTRSIRA